MKGSPTLLTGGCSSGRIAGCLLVLLLLPGLGFAQVTPACDWSQWFGIPNIAGTLTIQGVGTGMANNGNEVTLNVAVNAKPEMGLEGAFSWSGFLNANVNYELNVADPKDMILVSHCWATPIEWRSGARLRIDEMNRAVPRPE